MNPKPLSAQRPTLVALLLLAPLSAGASVIIDDFSVNSSIVINAGGSPVPISDAQTVQIAGQSATRTFQAGATTGEFQGQIKDNSFGYASIPGNTGNASLGYTGFNVDLSATPFLRLDFTGVSGTGSFVVELQGSVTPFTIGHLPVALNTSPSSTLFFDVRDFAGYQPGFLTGVNTFIFAVEGTGGPAFFMNLGGISFTSSDEMLAAIPEPATTGWIAGGLLAAGALVRRTRRQGSRR
ncbi:MAG: hypothetical protein JNL10_13910 [Verrucomicrobiales bacterium]|nr:hypothetical protein [Verrucomicrobiales bacterium]